MRIFVSILLLYFMVTGLNAQEFELMQPDYNQIEKDIAKEGSPWFYPKLFEKFQKGDTTLTLKEKRYIYYGFIFSDDYSSYEKGDYADSLRMVTKKNELEMTDFEKIIEYSDKGLEENPFNMDMMNYQLYACEKLQLEEKFNTRITQMRIIVDAMLSSGDGKTKETAFYVINVPHEYAILTILGYRFGMQQSLIEHYDYLTLDTNDEGIEGLYFDISPSLNAMSNMFGK